ncbi:PP2C family protein-serine/threonine phosphatase [Pseudoprimorskyibacter insulae]|uniref:Transcriptional regulatory protein AfsQ1 n=1 Tax=Pseudoprimorskyibacter insulae TaxID=1695997 RepID=A0A2R8ATF6_9RHOB|nr:fused response regulator/phosphatase [Pseudoprimorskyibacter insulae]SPF79352.1 Transcriptional regulatory protein AfsQ1 [Pseudoprimorskyibacter insulae]
MFEGSHLQYQVPISRQADTPTIRRALIVDDSELQRRILRAMLNRTGFEVFEAASGQDALNICAEHHPDLVLSDWMMPGMDGLEFCREFRRMERESYGYFILLTAKQDKEEVARGLDAGADDFLSKPINGSELRARINAGDRILRMQQELSEKNAVISETLTVVRKLYDDIDKDLQQARRIQESLVPARQMTLRGSRVSLLLRPCGHVGGDLVGMFTPGDCRLGMYNIDVSGHGITSAMITARVAGYLSSEFPEQNLALEPRFNKYFALRDPTDVAQRLNRRLMADHGVNEYLTMAYANVDMASGLVKFVQAGHPPPLLMAADGSSRFIGDGGMPIGLLPDPELETTTLRMNPGDQLLFYSDGITECILKNGNMLEEEGLQRLVTNLPDSPGSEFLDDLYWALCQMARDPTDLKDDVSAVLLEYQPNT